MLLRCPGKEPLSRSHITPSAQEEVDRAARFIDGAIQVDPLTFDLDVSLIHASRVADRPRVPAPAPLKFRQVTLHPHDHLLLAIGGLDKRFLARAGRYKF
jgi:hypothetical protein